MIPFNFGPCPYPIGAFHSKVQKAVQEVLDKVKAPDAQVAMLVEHVMATVCQGLAVVEMPTGQISPLSLFHVLLGETGERKTGSADVVVQVVHDHDVAQAKAHTAALAEHECTVSTWLSVRRGLQQKLEKLIKDGKTTKEVVEQMYEHMRCKPAVPRLRQIIRKNITSRALAGVLEGDGESVALSVNEGAVLVNSDLLTRPECLNSAWNGTALTLDRADGQTILALNPRVSMNLMIQPSKFMEFMERFGESARGSGLFSRCLFGYPASTQGIRFIGNPEPQWEHLPAFYERARALLEEYDHKIASGVTAPTVLRFSEDARERWVALVNYTEARIGQGGELYHIRDFVNKAGEQTARVAAILHYFSEQEGDITVDTLERAISIIGWHMGEYGRLMAEMSGWTLIHSNAYKLARYLKVNFWSAGFGWVRRNDVLRNGPVRPKQQLELALQVLIDHGYVWLSQDKSKCWNIIFHWGNFSALPVV